MPVVFAIRIVVVPTAVVPDRDTGVNAPGFVFDMVIVGEPTPVSRLVKVSSNSVLPKDSPASVMVYSADGRTSRFIEAQLLNAVVNFVVVAPAPVVPVRTRPVRAKHPLTKLVKLAQAEKLKDGRYSSDTQVANILVASVTPETVNDGTVLKS